MVDVKSLHCQETQRARTEQDTSNKATHPFDKESKGILEKGVEDSSVNKSLELMRKSKATGLDAQMQPCVCSLKRVSGRAD